MSSDLKTVQYKCLTISLQTEANPKEQVKDWAKQKYFIKSIVSLITGILTDQ